MFCQADNIRKSEQRFTRWVTLVKYLFTPEDSRDTMYRDPAADVTVVPPAISVLKLIVSLGVALGIALLLSRLQ